MEGSILEAQGLELIDKRSGSPSTSTFFIQSYHDKENKIGKNLQYALKTITLLPPVTTKNISQQSINFKYKEQLNIRTQIKALYLLKPYRAIVQLYEVVAEKEGDPIINDFFRYLLGKQQQKGINFGLLLEYCPQGSLADRIKNNYSFNMKQIVTIGLQISECLQCLAEVGVLHRDIRSDNIFLTEDGVKLSDFDCSFIRGYSNVSSAGVSLREQNSAPELLKLMQEKWTTKEQMTSQELYRLQSKCDLYSFGLLLLELITGHNSIAQGLKNLKYNSQIDNDFKNMIVDLLKSDHAQRLDLQSVRAILKTIGSKFCLHVPERKIQHHKQSHFILPDIVFHPSTISNSHSNSISLSDWSLEEDLPKLVRKQICPPSPAPKMVSQTTTKFKRACQRTMNV